MNVMRVTVLTPCSLDRTKHNRNIRKLAACDCSRCNVTKGSCPLYEAWTDKGRALYST